MCLDHTIHFVQTTSKQPQTPHRPLGVCAESGRGSGCTKRRFGPTFATSRYRGCLEAWEVRDLDEVLLLLQLVESQLNLSSHHCSKLPSDGDLFIKWQRLRVVPTSTLMGMYHTMHCTFLSQNSDTFAAARTNTCHSQCSLVAFYRLPSGKLMMDK